MCPLSIGLIWVFREQSLSCIYLFEWLFFSPGRLPRRNPLERSAKLKSSGKRRRKRPVKTRNDRNGRRKSSERTRRRSTSFSKTGRKKWTISRTLRNPWKASVKLDALSLHLWTNVLNLWKIQVGNARIQWLVSLFLVKAIAIVCQFVYIFLLVIYYKLVVRLLEWRQGIVLHVRHALLFTISLHLLRKTTWWLCFEDKTNLHWQIFHTVSSLQSLWCQSSYRIFT